MTHMTRFVLTAAVLVMPVTAFSQAIPVPPVPPAPPAPVVAPIPPPPPMPVEILYPGFAHSVALEAMLAADAQVMTAEQARVMSQQAIEESRRAVEAAALFGGAAGSAYDAGLQLMSRRDYERAITRFDQVVKEKASRADGALYHKAYALYRLGRANEATTTLAELRKSHPQSRYLKDVSALETTIRQSAGQPISPEVEHDEELKLLAINALVHTDPERALPLLEGVINGGANSLQLKTRAIFVLSQSSQPRAKEILMSLAKGAGNPDLQARAIQYLATRGRERVTSAELKQIYDSTTDADIKRAVINAWGTMGATGELGYVVAAGNADMAIRTTALNRMSDPAAADTLWAIYQKEPNRDLRMSILSRLGSMGATERLLDVVRSEKDVEIRRRAIRSLGNMRADKSGAVLSDLYGREQDVDNKKAIITALGSQQNGEALVAIARKETDMTLKRDIVQRLSNMRNNKAAMDYMLEIIK
jgi:HEAT repeat protein